MNIRKGDTVEIVSGNDAGRRGEVLQLVPDRHGVVVEGANVRKKHQKQQAQPKAGVTLNKNKEQIKMGCLCVVCVFCFS